MSNFRLSIWHTLIPALGLHGLLLAYPIDLGNQPKLELKSGKPIRVVKLPRSLTPQPAPKVTAKRNKDASGAQRIPLKISKPAPLRVAAAVQTLKPPVQAKPLPSATPQPSATPSPLASLTPTPTPVPSSPVSGGIQVKGATPCSGAQDCYALSETNGRAILPQIEAQLQRQGYALQPMDIEDDTGMSVYLLSKANDQPNAPKDYLHVLWTDQGTTYLRSPLLLSRQELELKAKG